MHAIVNALTITEDLKIAKMIHFILCVFYYGKKMSKIINVPFTCPSNS